MDLVTEIITFFHNVTPGIAANALYDLFVKAGKEKEYENLKKAAINEKKEQIEEIISSLDENLKNKLNELIKNNQIIGNNSLNIINSGNKNNFQINYNSTTFSNNPKKK